MPSASRLKLPWIDASPTLGNLAVGNLRETLMATLKDDLGIHVETLMVCVGALHGYSARHATLERAESWRAQGKMLPGDALVEVQTTSGDLFTFGDWINEFIFPNDSPTICLAYLVYGKLQQFGFSDESMPDLQEMAHHYANALGTSAFETVRSPLDNTPHIQPREAIQTFWPAFLDIMKDPGPESAHVHEPLLDSSQWPVIAALVAGQLIEAAKDACDPLISAQLIFEAAMIGSKIEVKL